MVAFVAGQTAPPGKRMGHAGAIVSGGSGTAAEKMAAFQAVGVPVARIPSEIPALVSELLARRRGRKPASRKASGRKAAGRKAAGRKPASPRRIAKPKTKAKSRPPRRGNRRRSVAGAGRPAARRSVRRGR